MDIKIVNRNAQKLHVAFGITEERSDEISNYLDKISKELLAPGADIRVCEHLKAIADFCTTPAELAYAIMNNVGWLKVKGFRIY